MESLNADNIIECLSNLSLEDVQRIHQASLAECLRHIEQRRMECEHPKQYRGKIAQERGPNIIDGCTYCVTPVRYNKNSDMQLLLES